MAKSKTSPKSSKGSNASSGSGNSGTPENASKSRWQIIEDHCSRYGQVPSDWLMFLSPLPGSRESVALRVNIPASLHKQMLDLLSDPKSHLQSMQQVVVTGVADLILRHKNLTVDDAAELAQVKAAMRIVSRQNQHFHAIEQAKSVDHYCQALADRHAYVELAAHVARVKAAKWTMDTLTGQEMLKTLRKWEQYVEGYQNAVKGQWEGTNARQLPPVQPMPAPASETETETEIETETEAPIAVPAAILIPIPARTAAAQRPQRPQSQPHSQSHAHGRPSRIVPVEWDEYERMKLEAAGRLEAAAGLAAREEEEPEPREIPASLVTLNYASPEDDGFVKIGSPVPNQMGGLNQTWYHPDSEDRLITHSDARGQIMFRGSYWVD